MRNNEGKYIFGLVKVGEKGQIVIPKEARDVFGIRPGDSLLVLGDEKTGIAVVKPDVMQIFDTIITQPAGDEQRAEDKK